MYLKNDPVPEPIKAKVIHAGTGEPITSGVVVFYLQGSTRTPGAGTLEIVGETWNYTPTQAETNCDEFAIEFYHVNAVGNGPIVQVVPTTMTQSAAAAVSSLGTITISRTWEVDGVLTDVTSAKLSDPTGTYGVKRDDTNAVVVADAVDMTRVGTGVYQYTFTEPASGLAYTAYIEFVYDGASYYFEIDIQAESVRIVSARDVMLEMGILDTASATEIALIERGIANAEGAVKRFLRYDPKHRQRTEFYPRANFSYNPRAAVWEVSESHAYLRRIAESASDELQLQHLPIRSIDALYIDYDGRGGARTGAFAAETLKVEGSDYWPNYDLLDSGGNRVCSDGILRSMGSWPSTPGCVKVQYTAGYKSAELQGNDSIIDATPIWQTVLEESARRARKALVWAKHIRAGHLAGVITNESLGDYSYSIDASMAAKLFGDTRELSSGSVSRLEPFVNWGFEQ